ncbi:hypothetical protein [Prochlorococcus sp. MIT 1306]|uniref:hypothetical protein n=1 Tax=Prochlorococcus sp. MIT 1306 TaxID=1799667 RepID=UPI0007B378D6|nr:hypothetical protein [Prochlorococcus sp. MIT 1306]KZR61076.1 hypothetical protein PMIT1306_01855 [Prochlorococcus sp. MIT 1306]
MELPERYSKLMNIIDDHVDIDGIRNIEVNLTTAMKPRERGEVLLDLEDDLIKKDPRVRIWHSPLGDKNSLRNLRGVEL